MGQTTILTVSGIRTGSGSQQDEQMIRRAFSPCKLRPLTLTQKTIDALILHCRAGPHRRRRIQLRIKAFGLNLILLPKDPQRVHHKACHPCTGGRGFAQEEMCQARVSCKVS